ncbi:MAG TPA: DNA repair protein RecO, partial [Phycisphaerales bacterium]|nr:DNA repair protein RecO [Phycisphaerales bacterium]
MPTIRDEAVCVRHWDFSETSQTVSLFLRDHGLVRGLAKGARRERGSFSGGFDL